MRACLHAQQAPIFDSLEPPSPSASSRSAGNQDYRGRQHAGDYKDPIIGSCKPCLASRSTSPAADGRKRRRRQLLQAEEDTLAPDIWAPSGSGIAAARQHVARQRMRLPSNREGHAQPTWDEEYDCIVSPRGSERPGMRRPARAGPADHECEERSRLHEPRKSEMREEIEQTTSSRKRSLKSEAAGQKRKQNLKLAAVVETWLKKRCPIFEKTRLRVLFFIWRRRMKIGRAKGDSRLTDWRTVWIHFITWRTLAQQS